MLEISGKLLKIWIYYFLFVFLSTELFSRLNLVNKYIFWGLYVFGAITVIVFIKKNFLNLNIKFVLPKYWRWYIVSAFFIILPLLFIALYYPPNNYDSLTYHLTRIEHWVQNGNVEFYPTNSSRQLFMTPLTEYVLLHWRLLTGGDIFANLLQFISMIFCALLSILIVGEFGGNKLAKLLAFILTITIPMGILQSTSTQTDYVTSFFVLVSIYFNQKKEYVYLALSLGMGLLTKNTFAVFLLPIGLYWVLKWFKISTSLAIKKIILIIGVVVLINCLHWNRNFQYFASVFGPKDAIENTRNSVIEFKYVVSNMARNLGNQLGLPNTKYNSAIDVSIINLHKTLDLKNDDEVNTWLNEKYSTRFSINENNAGNFLHVILIILVGIILSFNNYRVKKTYFLLFGGWILFNVLFKWQPWGTRLELPYIIANCPIIAYVLVKYLKNENVIKFILLILMLMSVIFVYGINPSKKIVGLKFNPSNRPFTGDVLLFTQSRYDRFWNNIYMEKIYLDIVEIIKNANINNVGIFLENNSQEYPLWVAIRQNKLNVKVNSVTDNDSFNKNFVSVDKPDVIIYNRELPFEVINKVKIIGMYEFGSMKLAIVSN
ncbi:MAG TPA: hypothetical protein VN174_01860 [Candidatus Methanoperedens sp.]|nr:hypothetical protein [Candidatus Methanoperedens sp.]